MNPILLSNSSSSSSNSSSSNSSSSSSTSSISNLNFGITCRLIVNSFHSNPPSLKWMFYNDVIKMYALSKEKGIFPSMTYDQYQNLLKDIRNNTYFFKPLEYLSFPLEKMNKVMKPIMKDYPDYYLEVENKSTFRVIKASNIEDSLVLKALSLTLQRLIYGSNYIGEYRLDRRFKPFTKSLSQMKGVGRIYQIFVGGFYLEPEVLINTVAPLMLRIKDKGSKAKDSYVLNLIMQMLQISIYNEKQNPKLRLFDQCLPLGDLNLLLLDVVLHTTFDRLFVERFPNLRVRRFLREIFIFSSLGMEEKTSSFEQDFRSFSKEIGMRDDYDFKDSQEEGGKLFCRTAKEMRLSIDPVGQVIVTDTLQDAENRTLEDYRAEEVLWTENDEEMWGPTEEESIAAEKALKEYFSDEEEILAAEEGLGIYPPTDEKIKAAENELDEIMSAAEDAYKAELLPSAKEDEKERKKEENDSQSIYTSY